MSSGAESVLACEVSSVCSVGDHTSETLRGRYL
nr:hypothetical protein PTVJELPE_PTVJELPE_CDS_0003 [Cressdnaviricota sp.]